ncbi:hypothetical protein ACXYL9_12905 [Qipengyuania sp. CAU 1752]
MKKLMFVASAAAISLSSMATPALAAVPVDSEGTNPVLDQKCADDTPPSVPSGFTAYALGATVGPEIETAVVALGPIYIVPIGSPTSVLGEIRTPHLNGGSPNIFGYANRTVVYPGGAQRWVNIRTTLTTYASATGCHVHKESNGDNDGLHPGFIAPPGHQRNTPFSAIHSERFVDGSRMIDTLPGPYTDPTQSEIDAQVLICISPSTKLVKGVPGTWVGKNGYTACSRALYDSLYSKFDPNAPPTNSLPST